MSVPVNKSKNLGDNSKSNFKSKQSSPPREPIAIVGIGCRFPGDIESPQDFWQLLSDKIDAISEVPSGRYDVDALYNSNQRERGKIATREGGFVGQVDLFDPAFFNISPREAQYIDPQQRLLMEITWEALEDGGQVLESLAGSHTGVFVGMWTSDYEDKMYNSVDDINLYVTTGGGRYSASGRLSYLFDLQGPSLTVDTACSSSLVAVHLACHSLWRGESSLALAGGVNLLLEPQISIAYSRSGMLSTDGRCKFGDEKADGYVRSEGAGIILLKPLSQAVADNDRIYALIQGSAVNNDGQSSGRLVAPGVDTQINMLRQAYQDAGISPGEVGYMEAHGTGTKVGDPVELTAIGTVMQDGRRADQTCLIGSVKTNIGHAEAASGIAGLIKAALVLNNRMIPPSLHFHNPNPEIPWSELPLTVPLDNSNWPTGYETAVAGVNSFGITGTNAHVVMTEYNPPVPVQSKPTQPSTYLLPISAKNPEALATLAQHYKEFLTKDNTQKMEDICFTAARRRTHFEHRLTATGNNNSELAANFADWLKNKNSLHQSKPLSPNKNPKISFIFSGQGSQWLGMGQELLETEPVFYDKIVEIEKLLSHYVDWSLIDELTKKNGRLQDTEIAQPAIFALQVGLAALLQSWGIEPGAVVGHSVGEVAAAHVAGVLSLPDAVKVVFHRSYLMQKATGLGKMAAVGLSRTDIKQHLDKYPGLTIGAENSPISLTLSGNSDALAELVPNLQELGLFARMLTVNYAFHSPVMEPFQQELELVLNDLEVNNASIPLYSTVHGTQALPGDYDGVYWGRNIREPVLFASAVQAMAEDGFTTFIEVSPHPVLTHSVAQCVPDSTILPSMQRDQAVHPILLQTAGALFEQGTSINWEILSPDGQVVPLPNYPWQKQRYWLSEERKRSSTSGTPTGNPLLGIQVNTPLPTFEAELDAAQLPNGSVHQLGTVQLLPATAHLEGLLAVGFSLYEDKAVALKHVVLEKPLLFNKSQTIQWLLIDESAKLFSLQKDNSWQLHTHGQLQQIDTVTAEAEISSLQSSLQRIKIADFEQEVKDENLLINNQSPHLTALWRNENETLARLQPAISRQEALDTAIQLLLMSANKDRNNPLAEYFLTSAEEVISNGRFDSPTWCHITITNEEDHAIQASIQFIQEDGQVLLQASGLKLEPIGQELLANSDDWFYDIVWETLPEPRSISTVSVKASGPWLILADKSGIGDSLSAALQANGAATTTVTTESELASLEKAKWGCIVYLWGLDETIVSQNGACEPVLALLKQTDAPIWIVTRQAQALLDDDEINPFSAPLWGLGRTISLEYPEKWGGLIDLDNGEPNGAALRVMQEILAGDDEDEIAYRSGQRFVSRLATADRPDESDKIILSNEGAYLITGGLGNLGLHVAQWLVHQGARHLILTSRSGLPPRDEWQALDLESTVGTRVTAVLTLEQLGATITIAQTDITNEEAMRQLFTRFGNDLPDLRGVIHAAGVTTTSPLAEMDEKDLRFVFAPKVNGTWLLHNLTKNHILDFFVLYSSAAAILGSSGMGHYAAANAFLDGLAHYRHNRGLPALSINWGWWAGDGIASDETESQFTEIGQNKMPIKHALNALANLLNAEQTQSMVAAIDWPRFKPIYEAKRTRPLLKNITLGSKTPMTNSQTFIQELTAISPDQQFERLRRYVQEMVAKILGFTAPENLDPDAGFFKTGMDSIMAVNLRTVLEQDLGQAMPTTIAFEYPTVNKLAKFIMSDSLKLDAPKSSSQVKDPTESSEEEIVQLDDLSEDELLSFFDDELSAIDDLIK